MQNLSQQVVSTVMVSLALTSVEGTNHYCPRRSGMNKPVLDVQAAATAMYM